MTQRHRISRTAQSMALFRALETVAPMVEGGAVRDPFARAFLPRYMKTAVTLARIPALAGRILRYIDGRAAGARTSGVARTALIDHWIQEALDTGASQLVILGAGFDCRSLRLDALAGTDIYELDRPEMLDRKDHVLNGRAARLKLSYVPIDFMKDDFGALLKAAGLKTDVETLFLWEGVTNYLDDRAVRKVLATINRLMQAPTRMIFTYVDKKAVDGTWEEPGFAALRQQLAKWGEPWTFGIAPAKLAAYLAKQGFSLKDDLDAPAYRALYYGSEATGMAGYGFYHVARATTLATTLATTQAIP